MRARIILVYNCAAVLIVYAYRGEKYRKGRLVQCSQYHKCQTQLYCENVKRISEAVCSRDVGELQEIFATVHKGGWRLPTSHGSKPGFALAQNQVSAEFSCLTSFRALEAEICPD